MVYSEDSDGVPHPELSIVLFADILGFKAELRDAFEANAGGPFLARVRKAVHSATEPLRERDDWCEYQIFSDSIIVGWPLRNSVRVIHIAADGTTTDSVQPDTRGDSLGMLHPLWQFQYRMLRAGFLVRGAVTVGSHFMGDKLAAGPALIDAVEYEQGSECEKDRSPERRRPRLVLNRSFIRALNGIKYPTANNALASYDRGEWLKINTVGVACDQPGDPLKTEGPRTYFIDYLESLLWGTAADKERSEVATFLQQHRTLIENGLTHINPDVCEKYRWLQDYHNAFCRRRPIFGLAAYVV